MGEPLRVLIADDSPLFQEVLSALISGDTDLQVVGIARNGREAVELTARLRPDVITMDVHMPIMGGLEAIEHIMAANPTPILVVTSDPQARDALTFEALRRGALDVMPKPSTYQGSGKERESLCERLKLISTVAVLPHRRPRRSSPFRASEIGDDLLTESRVRPALASADTGAQVVAIAASTGGPATLAQILERLPSNFPAPILLVQHIAPGFCASFAAWLDQVSPLRVSLAQHGEPLQAGRVLVAPHSVHLLVNAEKTVSLDDAPPLEGHLPSATLLLSSVARAFGHHAVGVVLTGMGRDGVDGLRAIREVGGVTVAQDESSCVVYGMPRVAVELGAAQWCLPPAQIAEALCGFVASSRRSRSGP